MKLKNLIAEEEYSSKVSKAFDNTVRKYLDALETYENGITRQKMLSTHYFSAKSDREKEKALRQLKLHQKEVEKSKKEYETQEKNYKEALEKELEKHLVPQFKK